ncbi:hypothetical protein AB0G04_41480 [Actinoplanes sp. NPDC023801]|uniref:hypothetical protein n=1 Tax=Actinoplanes sp. NPDC023801 TaxID=3154595 RepID=UPI0033EFB57A
MNRPRPVLIAVLAAGVLAAGGLLWWGLLGNRSPWVPTCTDLAPGLQAELGGGWTVTDPDEYRARSGHRSSSTCVISFVTADQKYTGTIDMFTVGSSDTETARREVESYGCGKAGADIPATQDYHAFGICSSTNNSYSRASVHAAKDYRRVTVSTKVNVREDEPGAAAYAQDLSRLVADRALTIAEPD